MDDTQIEKILDQIESDLQEAREDLRQVELSDTFRLNNVKQLQRYQQRVTENSQMKGMEIK